MPACAIQHRTVTGRFVTTLIVILLRKSTCCAYQGVLLLKKGGGTKERHYVRISVEDEMFSGRIGTFRVNERRVKSAQFGVLTAVSLVFMSCFLLSCGDVESNPGPTPTQNAEIQSSSGAAQSNDGASQTNAVLEAISRLETKQDQTNKNLTENICEVKKSVDGVKTYLSEQISRVEQSQKELCDAVGDLQSQCNELQQENQVLRRKLNQLEEKCDSLENESRRNNLLFFGVKKNQNRENWEESEKKVRRIIREALAIWEDISIERAHRTNNGSAIIVKLGSFKQKELILRKARLLKSIDNFKDVFIREDFSLTVRQKRRGLKELAKQKYNAGSKPKWRFDKLVTDDGIYTYDLEQEEVIKVQRKNDQAPRQRAGDEVSERGAVGGAEQGSSSQNGNDFPFWFPIYGLPASRQRDSPEPGHGETTGSSDSNRQSDLFASEDRNSNRTSGLRGESVWGSSAGEPCIGGGSNQGRRTSTDQSLNSVTSAREPRHSHIPQRVRSPVKLRTRSVDRPKNDNTQPKITSALNKSGKEKEREGSGGQKSNIEGMRGANAKESTNK